MTDQHQGKTDRELLIETRVDVDWLKTAFAKHLEQHFRLNMVAVGAALSFIGAVLLLVLK